MNCAIKVCGVRSAAFAQEAVRLGVEYLGFIFAPKSVRYILPSAAAKITAQLPRTVKKVGVFTTATLSEIKATAKEVGLDVVQLHGSYGAADIAELKACGYEVWLLDNGATPPETMGADALLIDGRRGTQTGGTGQVADWTRVAELKRGGCRVVLAGGIGEENIVDAAKTGADILDLNSKLETRPGEKSIELLTAALGRLRNL